MPYSVRTLKPCQWGRVSRPATGEFLGTKVLQVQRTVGFHAPLTAGPNSFLNRREGPAIIPQELVAENGLFQPKLILAPKTPQLTPRLDHPEVGTRQLTLCPSSTNSAEASPNLAPSEVPASGHHRFIKWGHDAKITIIGVIPMGDSPGQGRANGSQDRRQDLGPIESLYLSAKLAIRSGLLVGIEIWGRQLTTRGAEIGVPKGGHFGCSK